ncbi:MAG: amidohydrolase family protein [Vitreimonas sp.]
MLRLGEKYQHLVSGAGCGCCNPVLQRVSRRLDAFSRRGFVAGLCAAAIAGCERLPSERAGRAPSPPQTAPGAGAETSTPAPRILLSRARVFDGTSGALRDAQVLVHGPRIESIDAANNAPPADATVVDCGNRVLMPGMIDAHWHTLYAAVPMNVLLTGDMAMIAVLSTAEAQRTIMRGFTTVRDLGGPVFSFKQAIDGGVIPGPRIFPSGAMITTSGGHGDLRLPFEIPRDPQRLSQGDQMGAAAIVDDVGGLRRVVREQLLQGASQVKLVGGGGVSSPRSPLDMMTFNEAEIREAVAVAHDWNTYLTIHASVESAARRAVAGGVDCIEHGHLMEERTARAMADNGIWLSMQPYLTLEDTPAATGVGAERALQMFTGTPRVYGFAKRFGIKTAWGSDLLFLPEGGRLQNVILTHLSNWYSNADVIRAATSVNAELLALSNMRNPYPGKLGVIERGAYADLLVVNGNPLENIRLLENPDVNLSLIMKDGRIHKNTL